MPTTFNKTKIFYLLAFVALPCFLSAQTDRILWSKKPLKWSDFKGNPDSSKNYAAVTRSSVDKKYIITPEREIHFTIAAWFYRDHSWVKQKYANAHTLEHEQLHFTIAELYARKMRKYLSEATFYDSTYIIEIGELFNRFQVEYRNEEKRYDEEIGRSINLMYLSDWVSSVDDEMKKLSKYADTTVVVKLLH